MEKERKLRLRKKEKTETRTDKGIEELQEASCVDCTSWFSDVLGHRASNARGEDRECAAGAIIPVLYHLST